MFGRTIWSLLLSLSLVSGVAQATLYDRGSGLIYDSDQNLTWLQNPFLATLQPEYFPLIEYRIKAYSHTDTLRGVVWDDWHVPDISELQYLHFHYGISEGNSGPFINIQTYNSSDPNAANNPYLAYWGLAYFSWQSPPTGYPARMDFNTGSWNWLAENGARIYGWAVRDGDVGPAPNNVPEPSTLALALLGIFGAASLAANRKRVFRTHPAHAR